jgi:hypothetical protein
VRRTHFFCRSPLLDDISNGVKALTIFALTTIGTIIFYLVNNVYVAYTANPSTPVWIALVLYYWVSNPIYLLSFFITFYVWKSEDEDFSAAVRGLVAANLIMISLDLVSLPFGFPSIFSLDGTTQLPQNSYVSPFGDYQLGRLFESASGMIGFWPDVLIHIIIPVVLDLAALGLVKPEIYIEAVEQA